ncbi:MAG: hypothetical protein IT305_03855 [Chloroflexi bacterium]|nr:hypothetical protein [Chloroflexota bacterium]
MESRYRHLIIFFVLLVLATACAVPTVGPQATPRTYRIAYFGNGGEPRPSPNGVAFVEGMSSLGYVVDQNLTIEWRWTDGRTERLPELARELDTLKLDAVFASSELPA